jgi:SAM-dependent methyltransferase
MLKAILRDAYHRAWVIPKIHRTYGKLSTADAFTRVYENKVWNPVGLAFDSGSGSIGPIADLYCQQVAAFIETHDIKRVADLGCGDFRVGRKLTSQSPVSYTGVDIVPTLIARNNKEFGNDRIGFECADLVSDPLPSADLCLIRQVLQHLSNEEIESVLKKTSQYQFVLVSEHIPKAKSLKSFNRDKPHGPDVRFYFGSGVYPDKPPFSRPIIDEWADELDEKSLLRTVLMSEHGI